MRLRSKEPYWLLKNGILHAYPSLRKDISCDVLVMGGGITGALLAYQVASEGYRTVLIDKRDVSQGSTSATTSLLQYEIDEPLYSLKKKVGDAVAIESYRQGIAAIAQLGKIVDKFDLDCDFIGGHPDFPQSYFVLGFGGNGITFSVMGMQMISDALAGRPNRFLEYFRFGR